MEPITAAFGLACIAAGGGAGFWLRKADARLTTVNDTSVVLQQARCSPTSSSRSFHSPQQRSRVTAPSSAGINRPGVCS